MADRPYYWQMIKEAIEALGGRATYREIKDFVWKRYGPDLNQNTLMAQIGICTVNNPSRHNYPENKKPRLANDSRYDFLYRIDRGVVVRYDPAEHGIWRIVAGKDGKLAVVRDDGPQEEDVGAEDMEEVDEVAESALTFRLESHLRDFIVQNLDAIPVDGKRLELYADDLGGNGVEYRTSAGIIDILALDEDDDFVVFELKVGRGVDAAVGQVLRYIGWVKRNLARPDQAVKGAIVVQAASESLRYAVSAVPDLNVFEYRVSFEVRPVAM